MIDFTKKITSERITGKKNYKSLDTLLLAFESDRGRIINSAAVRRLQQKTQVFPLERNSAVRSRFTHSLEVQQVGRFIVQKIFKALNPNQLSDYKLDGLERCLESVVEMSCLLLDKRLFKKLPNKHLSAYENVINENSSDEDEYYYRCSLFQDYISGMTDQFAYDEYRALMISD